MKLLTDFIHTSGHGTMNWWRETLYK